jgi:hypothetical protein
MTGAPCCLVELSFPAGDRVVSRLIGWLAEHAGQAEVAICTSRAGRGSGMRRTCHSRPSLVVLDPNATQVRNVVDQVPGLSAKLPLVSVASPAHLSLDLHAIAHDIHEVNY